VTATPPTITPAPTCKLSISPTYIQYGQGATLTWSSTNATTLVVNGVALSPASSGSKLIYPKVSSNYTGAFTGSGGTATCYTSISVAPVSTSGGGGGVLQ
jgi:hypothetical protein